jgi:hypothetical protein
MICEIEEPVKDRMQLLTSSATLFQVPGATGHNLQSIRRH